MSNSLQSHGLYSLRNSPGQNTGVLSLSLLQGIFATQELGPPALRVVSLPTELSENPQILCSVQFSSIAQSCPTLCHTMNCSTPGLPVHHHHLYGASLLGFLWPVILICLVQHIYLVYLRVFPCMHTHFLAKMDSTREAYR